MSLRLNPPAFCGFFFPVKRPNQNLPTVVKQKSKQHRPIRCTPDNEVSEPENGFTIYKPTIWSHDFIKTLDTRFPINDCIEKMKELEKKLVSELNIDYENGSMSSLQLLELIDSIEKLGLGYRFQNNIRRALDKISPINENNVGVEQKNDDLHAASLRFRLLRQHDYNVSQEFLRRFKDNHGDFMESVGTDVKGLLSLYEASYLAFEGERDLHDAKLFATRHLLKLEGQENEVGEQVNHALELPLYRRMPRLQARWYIDAYSKKKDANLHLLELATLDFNILQSAHKRELQQVLKWWKNIGLASKLEFVRDRPVECFFCSVGVVYQPQYDSSRLGLTKVGTLISTLDDIYDVYGSLDELKIFTDAVKRWDIDAEKHMPEYLQLSFLALNNTVNEMGNNTLIAPEENIVPILAQAWGDLCGAFFVEAKWIYSNSMPTFEEYIENAWRSVSGVVILTHAYFLIYRDINKEALLDSYEKCRDLFKWSSMIFRLCNDLCTSSDEIKSGKSKDAITCYMHENGVSEKVARQYIKTLIDEAWMKLIEARVACSQEMADTFLDTTINLARMAHCMYQYGDDAFGAPDARNKDRVLSVLIEPITIKREERQ